jgi:predicted dienelactone hydrolase
MPGNAAPAFLSVTNPVDIVRYDWFDEQRNRPVPVKIYFPRTGAGPFPIIIFSHGLGGSREGYEYLGQCWAAHGYVSVHLQHPGSDDSVWQNVPRREVMPNMRKAAASPSNLTNRPLDISFVIDRLEKFNAEASPLKGRLDLARIGVAGHSFGAFTTLAVAGETFVSPTGQKISFGDPRVKAAIAMSAPVPREIAGDRHQLALAFGQIHIPILHMTGTKDNSPIGETRARDRRLPFDYIHGADQFLITFNGADHMLFSGRSFSLPPATEALFKEYICETSTAFWDACLKNDSQAKTWLMTDFKTELGTGGTFEIKLRE